MNILFFSILIIYIALTHAYTAYRRAHDIHTIIQYQIAMMESSNDIEQIRIHHTMVHRYLDEYEQLTCTLAHKLLDKLGIIPHLCVPQSQI
jgi:hypothetical protein